MYYLDKSKENIPLPIYSTWYSPLENISHHPAALTITNPIQLERELGCVEMDETAYGLPGI
jgi:hypothetical protein